MTKIPLSLMFMLGVISAWPVSAQTVAVEEPIPYAGGLPTAPVKIEVFSDYQCPACRRFYLESIRQVLIEYSKDNKVCVVYYDFPLQAHTHSKEATRYAMAAHRLGREQWLRVIEALYADQDQWSQDGNIEVAVSRALSPEDLAAVKEMLNTPEIEKAIENSIAIAKSRDISSTPTFFITAKGKEQRVVGGVSYPILKYYLEQILR